MSGKMVLHFAAAVLVVFLSNGASEAKSVARKYTPPGCPIYDPNIFTACWIGPNFCLDTSDCKDGKICCPVGCGGECTTPKVEGTAREVKEEQPTPVSDQCNSLFSPMIFCPITVNRCETHEECGDGRVCCPFANCGTRCQRAPVA